MKLKSGYEIFKLIDGDIEITGEEEHDRIVSRRVYDYMEMIQRCLFDIEQLVSIEADTESKKDAKDAAIEAIKHLKGKINSIELE